MATSEEYLSFVCEQIARFGAVRYRKMFGDAMVYLDDKPILLVCDNTVFVKCLPETAALLSGTKQEEWIMKMQKYWGSTMRCVEWLCFQKI